MAAAYTVLEFLSGATTTSLVSSGVHLQDGGWAPVVPRRRRSLLGGASVYGEVEETLILNLDGSTILTRLETIARLLDQAERWRDDENVEPVLLRVQPQGSTLSDPLQAVIVGGSLEYPASFTDMLMSEEVNGVSLRVVRGPWLGATSSATSSSAQNPNILTATFSTEATIASPITLALNGFSQNTYTEMVAGILLIARSSSYIQITEAETMTATAWTSVTDSTNNARGGSVLRYTPTGTTAVKSGTASIGSSFRSSLTRFGVYAAVKNNSSSATYLLRAGAYDTDSAYAQTTDYLEIAPYSGFAAPKMVSLGTISLANAGTVYLEAQASSADTHLDIDYIVLLRKDDPYSYDIAHEGRYLVGLTSSGATAISLLFDDQSLSNPRPKASLSAPSEGKEMAFGYSGDIALHMIGTTVAALWMAPGAGAKWRYASTTAVSNAITVSRTLAYLTPQ